MCVNTDLLRVQRFSVLKVEAFIKCFFFGVISPEFFKELIDMLYVCPIIHFNFNENLHSGNVCI